MALLGAEFTSLRKTRHGSMMMLRAASQMNLNEGHTGEEADLLRDNSKAPKSNQGSQSHNHKSLNFKESMVIWLSALYGKLLIVIGMGFPIAKVLSPHLPLIYYNSFYLYLYFGSIVFVIYAYCSLLSSFTFRLERLSSFLRDFYSYIKPFLSSLQSRFSQIRIKPSGSVRIASHSSEEETPEGTTDSCESESINTSSNELDEDVEYSLNKRSKFVYTEKAGHGSMYLKMGTIIFGIGSMIYSGLEFGQYFELKTECSDILMAVNPATRMVFTFMQMYFVFIHSRVSISRHTTIARFGFMHMMATNLCIWLNILVEETKHTIHDITHTQSHSASHDHEDPHEDYHYSSTTNHSGNAIINASLSTISENPLNADSSENFTNFHFIVKRASGAGDECRIYNFTGNMVSSAAPLLFPCTIEYSLLCAILPLGVIYTMWKHVLTSNQKKSPEQQNELNQLIAKKVRHLYSVDCGRASRGLFSGIFMLVLTLISLICFYVLLSDKNFTTYGIVAAYSSEILIYCIGIVTTVIGLKQLKELGFDEEEEIELDSILLIIAQGGVYMFCIFTLIAGYFSAGEMAMSSLTLITAFITLIQATLQTIYILDGTRRFCTSTEQLGNKSGREMVTFLLVLNLSMWLLNTFQTSRTYMHKSQKEFYGAWAWTIISHVSMPLAIFYRFHATVCLGEIWKRAYKMKEQD